MIICSVPSFRKISHPPHQKKRKKKVLILHHQIAVILLDASKNDSSHTQANKQTYRFEFVRSLNPNNDTMTKHHRSQHNNPALDDAKYSSPSPPHKYTLVQTITLTHALTQPNKSRRQFIQIIVHSFFINHFHSHSPEPAAPDWFWSFLPLSLSLSFMTSGCMDLSHSSRVDALQELSLGHGVFFWRFEVLSLASWF